MRICCIKMRSKAGKRLPRIVYAVLYTTLHVQISAHCDVKTKTFVGKLYANVQLFLFSALWLESVTRGAGIREDPEPDRGGEKADTGHRKCGRLGPGAQGT